MIRGLSVAQFISRPRLAHILAVGAVLAVLSVVHLGLLAEVQSPSPVDGARPTGWWSKVNLPGLRPSSHGKFQGHGQEWQWDGAATDMYDGYNGDGHGFIYRNKHNDGPCAGWDRHGLKEDDPPGCLRARQWRELQHFRALEGSGAFEKKLQDHNQLALDRVERCVLGFLDCPDRPLIVSTYGYMNMRLDTSGEAIWLYPVMKAAEEMRFNFITLHMEEGWNVTQLLPSVVHSLWQNSVDTFKCQTNPLCIRPEDYVPAEDERFRHDLSLVPKSRMGNLPPWRMFTVDFWGARASGYGAPGINVEGQWGITKDVKDWSPHLLGNKFQFVPYPYPGHTHIPISIEQRCLHAEYVPYERRNQSALVLAKRNRLFHDDHNKPIEDKWPQIAGGLKDIGYDLLAVATMEDKDEENKKKYPIPPELNNLGRLTSDGYSRLVSNQRALLGIGKPEISPSPYVAVCLGVPVVMPYYTALGPVPDGPDKWELFDAGHAQHGPFNTLGEPYVYTYNMSDPADLVAKLRKAVQTPIKPYIPDNMRMENLRRRVHHELFETDWQAEYEAKVRENGGVVPKFPAYMTERCYLHGFCKDSPVIGKSKEVAFNLYGEGLDE